MSIPSLPTGYDVSKYVLLGRPDRLVTIGFDRERSHILRFLVQLRYRVSLDPLAWKGIAWMDHNETSEAGHDIYHEGLHVDIERRTSPTVHLVVPHEPLPQNRGIVVRGCAKYFAREGGYFVEVYEERQRPGSPPRWSPDGGGTEDTFIRPTSVEDGMSEEPPVEDALTPWELSELLAEVTGTTPEAIERGAAELQIGPPWEGEIVDDCSVSKAE